MRRRTPEYPAAPAVPFVLLVVQASAVRGLRGYLRGNLGVGKAAAAADDRGLVPPALPQMAVDEMVGEIVLIGKFDLGWGVYEIFHRSRTQGSIVHISSAPGPPRRGRTPGYALYCSSGGSTEITAGNEAPILKSYLEGRWLTGTGAGHALGARTWRIGSRQYGI